MIINNIISHWHNRSTRAVWKTFFRKILKLCWKKGIDIWLRKRKVFPQNLKVFESERSFLQILFNKPPHFPTTAMCEWKTLDESQCLGVDDLIKLLHKQNHELPSLQGLYSGTGNEKITVEDFRYNSAHIFPPTRADSIYLHKCAFVHVTWNSIHLFSLFPFSHLWSHFICAHSHLDCFLF